MKTFRHQNQQGEEMTLEEVKAMTLSELSKEKITFGKAHLNKPFPMVFNNFQPWVDWFVGTYESSLEPCHQKFIRYVELRLDSEINQDSTTTLAAKSKAQPKQKGYPVAKSIAQGSTLETDPSETDWEEEFEMMSSHAGMINVQEELENVRLENRQMSSRMAQLEMSMQEMIHHLQKLTVKPEM